MTKNEARTLGRNAFLAGESSAPILNRGIAEAVADLPVGGGAAEIMRAFSAEWHAANLEAVVA